MTTNSNQVATNPFDGDQTNISANTPTFIQLINLDGEDGFGLTSIEFRSDGTATVTEIDEDGTFTENWEYTTEGDLLTITDEFGVTDVFEYFIVGNTLTMVITDIEDYCGDYGSQAECFTETEALFELTQGSLTAVSLQLEIILNQAAAKQCLNVGRTYNLIDPTKVITDYKLKIKNIKQTQ